jgi:4-carboxymuconolactone decarboxylase
MSDDGSRLARGMAVRREVLGDDHVERSMSSLINLAMLTALNRMHEFRVHVRGAINNGATVEEIRETLLQTMVYCGAPAGLESFREAQAVLDELAATRA